MDFYKSQSKPQTLKGTLQPQSDIFKGDEVASLAQLGSKIQEIKSFKHSFVTSILKGFNHILLRV